jgi:hypothetical protein
MLLIRKGERTRRSLIYGAVVSTNPQSGRCHLGVSGLSALHDLQRRHKETEVQATKQA